MPYKNREAQRAHARAYYLRNREEIITRVTTYYFDHLEEKRAYNADYYLRNRDKILAQRQTPHQEGSRMTWTRLTTKDIYPAHATSTHPLRPVYDYAAIRAHWGDIPDIKIRYAPDETGWAKQLSPQHACLANISTTVELRLYDIVEMEEDEDPAFIPWAGECFQTYYTYTLRIRYPAGATQFATRRTLQALSRILTAVDGALEGLVSGFALANVPPQCDIEAVLATLHQEPGVQASVVRHELDEENPDV